MQNPTLLAAAAALGAALLAEPALAHHMTELPLASAPSYPFTAAACLVIGIALAAAAGLRFVKAGLAEKP